MRIFKKDTETESDDWLILSDVSMGGFIIFLVIAIAYIAKHTDYYKKQGIYDSFKSFGKSEMIDVLEDGTIRFSAKDTTKSMFEGGKSEIDAFFKHELDSFLPEYFDSLKKVIDFVQEVRIEGHTDTICRKFPIETEEKCYLRNLRLSQDRAHAVLKYTLTSDAFESLDTTYQNKVKKLLVSIGYSYSKALDDTGKYASKTKKPVNPNKSRRVDFRILIKPNDLDEVED